ncbi:MAG: alpha-ketoglutarate-dependent dioxygenase AlkB family protein [Methylocella sp.]
MQPNDWTLADEETGKIVYRPGVYSHEEAETLFQLFVREIPWSQDTVRMYDRMVAVPRLRKSYLDVAELPEALQAIRARVEAIEGTTFNRVSLNYYRDQNDGVAWHSDHEEEMIDRPTIVLVSLGAPRPMDIRERANHRARWHITLEPGSLLTMSGYAQRHYEHAILKLREPTSPRISIALRQYAPDGAAHQPCAQCAGARARTSKPAESEKA